MIILLTGDIITFFGSSTSSRIKPKDLAKAPKKD